MSITSSLASRSCALVSLAVGGLLASTASAQLDVSCRARHSRLVQYERAKLQLTFENESGQAVHLGAGEGEVQLQVEVTRTPDRRVHQRAPVTFKEPVVLQPHKKVRREIDLLDFFDMHRTGPYAIRARLNWNGLSFSSAKAYLDVVPGMEMKSLTAQGAGGRRVFSLLTLHREQSNQLFVRVDDKAAKLCLGVYELGHMMRLYEPTIQMDAVENVHILHLSGPNVFTHSIFSVDGTPVAQSLHPSDGRAHLTAAPGGQLVVKVSQPPASAWTDPPQTLGGGRDKQE